MIKFTRINGATGAQASKLYAALATLNDIWTRDDLKEKVLAARFMGIPGYANTASSPERVWNEMQIMFNGGIGIEMNVVIPSWWQRMHWRFSGTSVLGYEENDQLYVYSNFLDSADISAVVENLGHETCHKIGYTHDFKATAQRPFSVPYEVGQFIGSLVK